MIKTQTFVLLAWRSFFILLAYSPFPRFHEETEEDNNCEGKKIDDGEKEMVDWWHLDGVVASFFD